MTFPGGVAAHWPFFPPPPHCLGPRQKVLLGCCAPWAPRRVIVNDSYSLDVCLLYPPFLVALAAVFLAAAYCELDVTDWFDKLNVDRGEVRLSTNTSNLLFGELSFILLKTLFVILIFINFSRVP